MGNEFAFHYPFLKKLINALFLHLNFYNPVQEHEFFTETFR